MGVRGGIKGRREGGRGGVRSVNELRLSDRDVTSILA